MLSVVLTVEYVKLYSLHSLFMKDGENNFCDDVAELTKQIIFLQAAVRRLLLD